MQSDADSLSSSHAYTNISADGFAAPALWDVTMPHAQMQPSMLRLLLRVRTTFAESKNAQICPIFPVQSFQSCHSLEGETSIPLNPLSVPKRFDTDSLLFIANNFKIIALIASGTSSRTRHTVS